MSTDESGDGAIVGVHKVAVIGRDPKPMGKEAVITETSIGCTRSGVRM